MSTDSLTSSVTAHFSANAVPISSKWVADTISSLNCTDADASERVYEHFLYADLRAITVENPDLELVASTPIGKFPCDRVVQVDAISDTTTTLNELVRAAPTPDQVQVARPHPSRALLLTLTDGSSTFYGFETSRIPALDSVRLGSKISIPGGTPIVRGTVILTPSIRVLGGACAALEVDACRAARSTFLRSVGKGHMLAFYTAQWGALPAVGGDGDEPEAPAGPSVVASEATTAASRHPSEPSDGPAGVVVGGSGALATGSLAPRGPPVASVGTSGARVGVGGGGGVSPTAARPSNEGAARGGSGGGVDGATGGAAEGDDFEENVVAALAEGYDELLGAKTSRVRRMVRRPAQSDRSGDGGAAAASVALPVSPKPLVGAEWAKKDGGGEGVRQRVEGMEVDSEFELVRGGAAAGAVPRVVKGGGPEVVRDEGEGAKVPGTVTRCFGRAAAQAEDRTLRAVRAPEILGIIGRRTNEVSGDVEMVGDPPPSGGSGAGGVKVSSVPSSEVGGDGVGGGRTVKDTADVERERSDVSGVELQDEREGEVGDHEVAEDEEVNVTVFVKDDATTSSSVDGTWMAAVAAAVGGKDVVRVRGRAEGLSITTLGRVVVACVDVDQVRVSVLLGSSLALDILQAAEGDATQRAEERGSEAVTVSRGAIAQLELWLASGGSASIDVTRVPYDPSWADDSVVAIRPRWGKSSVTWEGGWVFELVHICEVES